MVRPMPVSEDLDLDVLRAGQQPLKVDTAVSERSERLTAGASSRIKQIIGPCSTARIPLPPPPEEALSSKRVANTERSLAESLTSASCPSSMDSISSPGYDGDPGIPHGDTGRHFVAHLSQWQKALGPTHWSTSSPIQLVAKSARSERNPNPG